MRVKPKRARPRPNMIHVDMCDKIRKQLDECTEHMRSTVNPFYGITQTVHIAIENLHAKIFG